MSAQPTAPPAVPAVLAEPRTVSDFVCDVIARYEILFLIILLALVFTFAAISSHHKHLWFDELFTVFVATQPTWHRFAQAMPAEGNPPMNTVLARVFIHLLGLSEFSVRLSSMLGFLAALVGVFVFVRRECGEVFGLLAVLLMLSEPAWKYSFEGRPYGVMLAFLMLALVSWQSATRAADATPPQPRGLALLGMVIGIVGCMLSHYIGVLEVGIPLIFGEGVRLYYRRRPDWPLLATGLSVVPATIAIVPMIRRTNNLLIVHSQALTRPLTLHKLIHYVAWAGSSWPLVIGNKFVVMMAVVIFLTWAPRGINRFGRASMVDTTNRSARIVPPHIFSAALGAMLLIPLTWFAMFTARGWYFCRYGVGTVAGIAMLCCLLFAKRGLRRSPLIMCLLALLTLIYLYTSVLELRERPPAVAADRLVYEDNSNLPIVISEPFLYLDLWWYAPPTLKDRVVYLSDPPVAMYSSYALLDAAVISEQGLISAPIKDYAPFIATEDHFLLDLGEETASLKDRLEQAGFRATLIRSEGTMRLYDMRRDVVSRRMQ